MNCGFCNVDFQADEEICYCVSSPEHKFHPKCIQTDEKSDNCPGCFVKKKPTCKIIKEKIKVVVPSSNEILCVICKAKLKHQERHFYCHLCKHYIHPKCGLFSMKCFKCKGFWEKGITKIVSENFQITLRNIVGQKAMYELVPVNIKMKENELYKLAETTFEDQDFMMYFLGKKLEQWGKRTLGEIKIMGGGTVDMVSRSRGGL